MQDRVFRKIDTAKLEKYFQGRNEAHCEELLHVFIFEASRHLNLMHNALWVRDYEALASEIQGLRDKTFSLGAMSVHAMLVTLEDLCQREEILLMCQLLQSLEMEIYETISFVENHLSKKFVPEMVAR